jgi:hypothetical protein
MDLIALFGVMRRRMWLILAVAVLCTAGVGYALRPGKLAYETQVRVQLSTPQSEDVALLNGYRASNVRDEATLARNNFLVVLKSPEVFDRTAAELGISPVGSYSVVGRQLRDTDFIDVTVRGETPEMTEKVANAHVAQSIQRYGELRAKPAAATRDFLAQQIQNASSTGLATPASATERAGQARQAGDSYDMLLKKYSEAVLAEGTAARATYVQVVSPAVEVFPTASPSRIAMVLGLAGVGGLGLGTVLAFLIESFRVRRVYVEPPVVVAYETARPARSALPQLALNQAFVDGTVLTEGEPIAAPAARWTPPPVVLDSVDEHRLELRRGLVASRYLLRQASALLDRSERNTVGAVVAMMRRDVDDAWRSLRGGAFPSAVANTLHRNIEGTVRTAELFGVRVTDALAIAQPVATSVIEDEAALDRLSQQVWSPVDALAVVQALASQLDGCPEMAEPASWTPLFELAAA